MADSKLLLSLLHVVSVGSAPFGALFLCACSQHPGAVQCVPFAGLVAREAKLSALAWLCLAQLLCSVQNEKQLQEMPRLRSAGVRASRARSEDPCFQLREGKSPEDLLWG